MQAFDRLSHPKKKPWDSPYGGQPPVVRGSSQQYVNLAQLPPKKFCLLTTDLPEDFEGVKKTVEPWMTINKVKGRYLGETLVDGKRRKVFGFKRTSDAVRFKLTWG